jgi:MoxR-like ATPase
VTGAVSALCGELERLGYIADQQIGTAVYLAEKLGRPLLIEGEAGVGKTELAKVLSRLRDTELIRLQCYEGLDVQTALYEWDYSRQLLELRLAEVEQQGEAARGRIYQREFLLERPLLRALTHEPTPAVLLIDEIDRADDAFEAFLLELLADFQVTIPELGTILAKHLPQVILTSNRTRELGDALRRRCLYLYLEHPSFEKELAILRLHGNSAPEPLLQLVTRVVQELRGKQLLKPPGISESIDLMKALRQLSPGAVSTETLRAVLGCVLKDRHDLQAMSGEALEVLLEAAREQVTAAAP